MGWAGKIMTVLRVIEMIFLLNILWVLGFIMGLGVFGAFPASRATFQLVNQGVLKKQNELDFSELIRQYFILYRASFKATNKFALIYLGIYGVLYFDFSVITIMPVKIKVFFMTLLVVLLCYVFLTNVYLIMSEEVSFNKVLIKRVMMMPLAFPVASIIFFIFVAAVTLLAVRFSFIFIAGYFSGIIIIEEFFLNENVRRRLAVGNH